MDFADLGRRRPMNDDIRIGIVGLDSSHAAAFAQAFNGADKAAPVVPGGRIVAAFPGTPSADFHLSIGRARSVAEQLATDFCIPFVDTVDELHDRCDALLITCVDSRQRVDQLRLVARLGKPVFVDKPFALSTREAKEMVDLARHHGVAIGSSSAYRFSPELLRAMAAVAAPTRVDLTGPLPEEPPLPWLFWYGVHQVEVLYRVLGTGCTAVRAVQNADRVVIAGRWSDGRVGTLGGTRANSHAIFGVITDDHDARPFLSAAATDAFAGQAADIVRLFRERPSDDREEEMVEIVSFIEAAQRSISTEREVRL
jgi:hypothetical protein